MDTKYQTLWNHAQYVGSETQWASGQYIILTGKAPSLIRDKMEYWGSSQWLVSDFKLWVYSEDCGRIQRLLYLNFTL